MKDHLATRGVEFKSINIVDEPGAIEELEALGVMALPVVARGTQYAIGLDMEKVFDLVGLDEAQPALLPAETLAGRISSIVLAAVRYASQLPLSQHNATIPGRDRTYLGLANHIVAHVEIFLTFTRGGDFTLDGVDSDVLRGLERRIDLPRDLVDRADAANRAFRTWLDESMPSDLERIVSTFFGEQTLHALLSSCAYSVAQHTRQLLAVLDELGVEADRPLGPSDYEGLPMPTGVWT